MIDRCPSIGGQLFCLRNYAEKANLTAKSPSYEFSVSTKGAAIRGNSDPVDGNFLW